MIMSYYIQNEFGSIGIRGQSVSIPPDPANVDFATYLTWVAAGNTPEPAPILEPPVPLTPAEKLAASGLTVSELKTLLGLK